jgi:hypothetical protein
MASHPILLSANTAIMTTCLLPVLLFFCVAGRGLAYISLQEGAGRPKSTTEKNVVFLLILILGVLSVKYINPERIYAISHTNIWLD